ncbi:biotin synthase BioB [Thermodesulfovibrionales bacterium]|nr:biotin synthase BioB [Thermodesulfovibrionales bacterium]MCL0038161.1 biotin synthase BioB [Thermodesulfovibrionales bacterium]
MRHENSDLLKVSQWQNLSTPELVALANRTRAAQPGLEFELCSIMNAKSGLCSEDCKFCAQSTHHSTQVPIYPLKDKKEILKQAARAKAIGAERFGIVASGKRIAQQEINIIAQIIDEVKERIDLAVCASLGSLNEDALSMLKQAGLDRYHHNIETSPEFFPQVVTTHPFVSRLNTITAAKRAGLEVCSGGIIGMGEKEADRISMALILKELDVDAVPINILIPIAETPFEKIPPISMWDILRTVALFRLILPSKTIKIAAGRESLGRFQYLPFMAGANGMLIGGYLTTRGRDVEEDWRLVEETKRAWQADTQDKIHSPKGHGIQSSEFIDWAEVEIAK